MIIANCFYFYILFLLEGSWDTMVQKVLFICKKKQCINSFYNFCLQKSTKYISQPNNCTAKQRSIIELKQHTFTA